MPVAPAGTEGRPSEALPRGTSPVQRFNASTIQQPPRVAFFDIGRTLAATGERSARRLLGERLSLTEKEIRKAGRLIMTHPATRPDELLGPLARILPGRAHGELLGALEAVWAEQESCVRPIPGTVEVLQAIKAMGIRLGVLSNTWHPLFSGFRENCPDHHRLMDHLLLSYREGSKKPSQDLFRRAVEAAGSVRAGECWMVGDSYELDVEPARSAGMRTVWVLSAPERERDCLARVLRGEIPGPDWAVEDLTELPQFLQGIHHP